MSDFQRRLQLQLPSPTQFFTPAVTVILVLIIIGFAFATYASEFVINTLALSSQGVFHGKVWQLITYPFVEISTCRLIPSGIILLFFGSAVERQWKTRGFLALFFLLSVSCGLLGSRALPTVLPGGWASGTVAGLRRATATCCACR